MKFSKVSYDEAEKQMATCFGIDKREENIYEALSDLKMPCRATDFSAGYDFYSPFTIFLKAGESARIPLFIKLENMPTNCVMLMFNRSGMSLNKGLRLDNGVAVIDPDFKDGILFQATATKDILIEKNQAICQGVFLPYIVVDNVRPKKKRNGGLGSTD